MSIAENNANHELTPDTGGIKAELSLLKEIVQAGLYEKINSDNLPILSAGYQDFLNTHKSDSMGARMSLLNRNLRLCLGDDESRQRILGQMAKVKSDFAGIAYSTDDKKEAKPDIPFWMSGEERESFRLFISLGDEKAINTDNIPGLAYIDPELVKEIRSDAIQNRINRLKQLMSEKKKAIGFNNSQSAREKHVVEEIVERIDTLTQKQLQLLKK